MNTKILLWALNYIPFLMFFSVLIAILKFKSIVKACPEILLYLGMALFFELFTRFFLSPNVNNLPYLHLYTSLEFLTISLFYWRTLRHYYSTKVLIITIVAFLVFAIMNAFFIQGLENFNSYARSIECIIIISFSLLYYFMMLSELSIKDPIKSTDFWLNTAFLIYFAGSFVLFILSNLLTSQSREVNIMAWGMHSFLLAILHIFISLGLWRVPPQ